MFMMMQYSAGSG